MTRSDEPVEATQADLRSDIESEDLRRMIAMVHAGGARLTTHENNASVNPSTLVLVLTPPLVCRTVANGAFRLTQVRIQPNSVRLWGHYPLKREGTPSDQWNSNLAELRVSEVASVELAVQ